MQTELTLDLLLLPASWLGLASRTTLGTAFAANYDLKRVIAAAVVPLVLAVVIFLFPISTQARASSITKEASEEARPSSKSSKKKKKKKAGANINGQSGREGEEAAEDNDKQKGKEMPGHITVEWGKEL